MLHSALQLEVYYYIFARKGNMPLPVTEIKEREGNIFTFQTSRYSLEFSRVFKLNYLAFSSK